MKNHNGTNDKSKTDLIFYKKLLCSSQSALEFADRRYFNVTPMNIISLARVFRRRFALSSLLVSIHLERRRCTVLFTKPSDMTLKQDTLDVFFDVQTLNARSMFDLLRVKGQAYYFFLYVRGDKFIHIAAKDSLDWVDDPSGQDVKTEG